VLHFTATEVFKNKVATLINTTEGVYTVGSLSLDNIQSFIPIEKKVFYDTFAIPDGDYALVTFHPETVSPTANYNYAKAMKNALAKIAENLYVVITMPNADTLGSIYREEIIQLKNELPGRILLIENFGKTNYFSAMYYAKVLIGNTSSGILEAASFEKYVVNVGDRQKGRVQSDNVLNCEFDEIAVVEAVSSALSFEKFNGKNIYYRKGVADTIVKKIKELL
jgi:GDP/UDP-N,N'-diacetylbacillosamine 2-epimerase (hydrolysing)